ncbi:MAG: PilT/PilU family type 4a pilus ATPase [Rickettsiales bacterium]
MTKLSAEQLLDLAVERQASDIYLTFGFPPTLRVEDAIEKLSDEPLDDNGIKDIASSLISEDQMDEFDTTHELNSSFPWNDKARFRLNIFRQQGHMAMVLRRIVTNIPKIEDLHLPPVYKELSMMKRGLILVVGQTGSGKSTSLAAMIGHRNEAGSGHIITVEDPVEFLHAHRNCIISQRDVGVDTYSFGMALKNALRQHPDVIMIGEIRDRETMEHAIHFSETGHLCLATLHANNSSQAIERVLNFFNETEHQQILLNLSLNLRAVLSQRLIANTRGRNSIAVEVLLNEGLIRDLIHEGKIRDIKDVMMKNRERGMQSFDQALLDLFKEKLITKDVAIAESDNPANLSLWIKQVEIAAKVVLPPELNSNVPGASGEANVF